VGELANLLARGEPLEQVHLQLHLPVELAHVKTSLAKE
jgi:hypothetical protein